VPDPALPVKPRPNSVAKGGSTGGEFSFEHAHNSMGFRDREFPLEKSSGVFRILVIGDSFTYGIGAAFKDTYPKKLEMLLNQNSETKVEVINAGMPRYFPEAERLLLEHYGLRFNPDLIVVNFSPNDLEETALGIEAVKPHPRYGFLMTKEARMLGDTGVFLFRHWHTFRILWIHGVSDKLWFNPHTNAGSGRQASATEAAWERVKEEYSKMLSLARSSGARIAFLYIPAKGPPWNEDDARRLKEWCDVNGVQLINALPPIRKASELETVYWEKDMHCNARGYEIIARALYKAIRNS